MSRIGLFFGSTDGHTAAAAARLKEMLEFPCLILGAPTWNHGQLQRDWERVIDEFAGLDLSGKRAAVFGLGDQVGYPNTFADALFFVADQLREAGAQLVGGWPVAGYDFRASWAVEDGQFLGLVLDEDNQPALTEERLDAWSRQIMREFDLIAP